MDTLYNYQAYDRPEDSYHLPVKNRRVRFLSDRHVLLRQAVSFKCYQIVIISDNRIIAGNTYTACYYKSFGINPNNGNQILIYSYSFIESMQTSVFHVPYRKAYHFDTLFCINLSSLKSRVPKMYPAPDIITRVRGCISFPLPFLFFQPHFP